MQKIDQLIRVIDPSINFRPLDLCFVACYVDYKLYMQSKRHLGNPSQLLDWHYRMKISEDLREYRHSLLEWFLNLWLVKIEEVRFQFLVPIDGYSPIHQDQGTSLTIPLIVDEGHAQLYFFDKATDQPQLKYTLEEGRAFFWDGRQTHQTRNSGTRSRLTLQLFFDHQLTFNELIKLYESKQLIFFRPFEKSYAETINEKVVCLKRNFHSQMKYLRP